MGETECFYPVYPLKNVYSKLTNYPVKNIYHSTKTKNYFKDPLVGGVGWGIVGW